MKNTFKMPGFIFLTMVLCFAIVSCDENENLGSQVTVSGSSLANKIEWVKNHRSSGTTYTIEVTADEEISGYEIISGSNKNMTIILNGNGNTISLKNDAAKWLFMIGDYVTLVLNDITLKGHDHNRAPLVLILGTLIMNDGTKIINNINIGGVGGVRVYGTFTMNGGKISGNNSGISARNFTMNGGEISGNGGGGVYIENYGVFTMNSGIISNNETGVSINEGTFTMNDGIISDNTENGVNVSGAASFIMTNGKISGNTGNGVRVNYIRTRDSCTPEEYYNESLNISLSSTMSGSITMSGGEISGNKGRGVYVNGADFIMTNGKISGNTNGGVYVIGIRDDIHILYNNGNIIFGTIYSLGTFTMNGGEISGNTSKSDGGGIYIDAYEAAIYVSQIFVYFRITNGTIYGSDATDVLKNTASNKGAALCYGVKPSFCYAQYGIYNGDTWIGTDLPLPDKGTYYSSTDKTIRVVNGVLQ